MHCPDWDAKQRSVGSFWAPWRPMAQKRLFISYHLGTAVAEQMVMDPRVDYTEAFLEPI